MNQVREDASKLGRRDGCANAVGEQKLKFRAVERQAGAVGSRLEDKSFGSMTLSDALSAARGRRE